VVHINQPPAERALYHRIPTQREIPKFAQNANKQCLGSSNKEANLTPNNNREREAAAHSGSATWAMMKQKIEMLTVCVCVRATPMSRFTPHLNNNPM
jgi:hypothetical protein